MGETVLNVTSSNESVLSVFAHCSKATQHGDVVMSFLNIHESESVRLNLLESLLVANHSAELFLLSHGTPISGASNPLQSRKVLLNGIVLELLTNSLDSPKMPLIQGKIVSTSRGYLDIPSATYGFIQFRDVNASACLSSLL